jgi:hypothetical protein
MMRSELNESLPRLLELITKETLRKYGTDQSEDTLVVRKSEVTEKMLVEFIAQFLEKLKDFRERRTEGVAMDSENDEPWMHYFNVEDFMTTFNARDSTK